MNVTSIFPPIVLISEHNQSKQLFVSLEKGRLHRRPILTFSKALTIISPPQLWEPTLLRGNNHDSSLSHFSPNNKPFLIQLGVLT